MKLMCPGKRLTSLSFYTVLFALLLSVNLHAQSKRTAPNKKAPAKKSQTQAKDARKGKNARDSKKDAVAGKKGKTDPRKEKADAKNAAGSKRDAGNGKLTAKERAARDKKNSKPSPAEARRLAERRREAEARRQAALAEQRRREQAAREARARKLAFERGLRTETVANIAKDDTSGEDINIRRAAVSALGGHAGTVVVMEAKTGRVLTIVNQDWAIRDSFKPCSTIKLVTGVAGINENLIDGDGKVRKSTGQMDLDYALAKSNNPYFQRVGVDMGSAKMIGYAKSLGLGEKTGINAEGETAGKLPYGNNNARIYSHGDDFEVTPLQLAVMVSAISNGGKKVVPQISKPRVERTFQPHVRETVRLPMRSVEGVLPGMIGAAEYGTARRGVDASMGVAGKTGSCIEKGSWVGLFASVAPVEDPKYSVVVITRGQSERGKYAAAIAGKIYQALGGQIKRNRDMLYARQLKTRPITLATAPEESEEGDDSDIAEVEIDQKRPEPIIVGAPRTQVAAAQPPVQAEKKLIQKTTQSKPTFSPVVIEFDKSGAATQLPPEKRERPRVVKNK